MALRPFLLLAALIGGPLFAQPTPAQWRELRRAQAEALQQQWRRQLPAAGSTQWRNFFSGDVPQVESHEFLLRFANDSGSVMRGDVLKSDSGWVFVSRRKGITRVLRPAQVKGLSYFNADGDSVRGVAIDSGWVFPKIRGRINVYWYPGSIYEYQPELIQRGDAGALMPYTLSALERMLADDPKALKMLSAGELLRAIRKYNE